jgi:hypothetical protein
LYLENSFFGYPGSTVQGFCPYTSSYNFLFNSLFNHYFIIDTGNTSTTQKFVWAHNGTTEAAAEIASLTEAGVFTVPSVVVNETGDAAGDLRAESDTEANMIFLDASANAVGIKQSAPTAYLHIGAGSATAGTAPLKMSSGALLATPEAGSIEFYDGRFFLTGTGKQRAIDRTSSNVNVANVVVAATAAETTLYLWSLSANAMKVGRIYKVHLDGILSAAANKTITFNFYFGTGLYVTSTTTPGNILNKPWHVEYTVTIRTTGNGGTSSLHRHLNINGVDSGVASLQAIDTTAANDVMLKVQWSDNNAGNSITLYQAYLELKN